MTGASFSGRPGFARLKSPPRPVPPPAPVSRRASEAAAVLEAIKYLAKEMGDERGWRFLDLVIMVSRYGVTCFWEAPAETGRRVLRLDVDLTGDPPRDLDRMAANIRGYVNVRAEGAGL